MKYKPKIQAQTSYYTVHYLDMTQEEYDVLNKIYRETLMDDENVASASKKSTIMLSRMQLAAYYSNDPYYTYVIRVNGKEMENTKE